VCGLEAPWSAGPLWWTSLSYTQSPHNLAILHLGQLSDLAVTAAVVAVNGLIAEVDYPTTQGSPHITSAFSASLRFVLHQGYLSIAAGLLILPRRLWTYNQSLVQPLSAALKVGIIQGNVPNEIKLYPAGSVALSTAIPAAIRS